MGIMPYDPAIHHRRSIRLPGYDYSQPGSYYVTLCTEGKEPLFGQIVEGEMHRDKWGDCVARCWKWLAQQYPYIDLDEWTVMPNHLHGIVVITGCRGASRSALAGKRVMGDGGGSRTAPTKKTCVIVAHSLLRPARRCFSPAAHKKLTSAPSGVYTAPELLEIAT